MKYNQDFSGIQIDDEIINRTSSDAIALAHDTILDDSSIELWTGAGGTGTQLTQGTDFTLNDLDTDLTTEAGADIYLTLAVINGTYHSTNIYVSYKTVGDFNDSADVGLIGEIKMWPTATAPNNHLVCDGTAVSRSEYFELYSVIGTTYGVGDNSTTFNVPDFNGRSPVGVGTSAGGENHVAETWTLAEIKNDQMQGHKHTLVHTLSQNGAGSSSWAVSLNSGTESNDTTRITTIVTDGTNGTPRTGTTTRSKGLGINFIIRAK